MFDDGAPQVEALRDACPAVAPDANVNDTLSRSESATDCKRRCNKKCDGASNKSKCVGTCRRACDG